ncbi:hypothetical protein DL89DRAFT_132954 [Linderina pennispora]|uniref:Uncharacterized protein n=1 Tax=Linderina pennispora TaxID=61395 RepID=A0A1Y1VV06_9FUNG|nr:uncharacterized protein DL89DRAFT_132954 [Linderina pennispora]ORX65107.1 hypothetical protein DL89DRAFT_132954 [Linderina pennispora]
MMCRQEEPSDSIKVMEVTILVHSMYLRSRHVVPNPHDFRNPWIKTSRAQWRPILLQSTNITTWTGTRPLHLAIPPFFFHIACFIHPIYVVERCLERRRSPDSCKWLSIQVYRS